LNDVQEDITESDSSTPGQGAHFNDVTTGMASGTA